MCCGTMTHNLLFVLPALPRYARCHRRARSCYVCCSDRRQDPYVTAAVSRAKWIDECGRRGFDRVLEVTAKAFAECFTEVYDKDMRIFIACGTGTNGKIGMAAAAILSKLGYETSVYYASKQRPSSLHSDISHFEFIPSTLEYYFDVVIDALMGTGYNGEDVEGIISLAYYMLCDTRLPVVSIDVPSGWHLESGPRDLDVCRDEFIKPQLLVSIDAPKVCAKMFAGALHYIGNIESNVEDGKRANLFASNAAAFQGVNGEIYGRPGQFGATLFTKRPQKRVWVDIDDDMDLWDELD